MSVTVRVQAHQNYLSESAGVKTVQSSSAGANVCVRVCVCICRGLRWSRTAHIFLGEVIFCESVVK